MSEKEKQETQENEKEVTEEKTSEETSEEVTEEAPKDDRDYDTIPEGENFEFAAEIQKLLNILIHSLYTQKEIFLRELISNAADALDKVRFKMLTEKNLRDESLPLEVKIEVNKDKNVLVISDSGIGMTKDELVENIGTIAHSGSMSFLKAFAESTDKDNLSLIGQFGVGFYSVFMVAKRVDVLTLSAQPDSKPYFWSSEGLGQYTIAETEKETRGTEIRVHLKDDAKEYLEAIRIKNIIQRYSDFVSYPIMFENEQTNKLSAIWHRPKSDVKEEEYDEFYSYLTHMPDKPLSYIHLSFDAPLQFRSILYVPSTVPWDMMFETPEKWKGVHLYAKKVFIQADCEELIPQYLRFVRGVVDSDDLQLNISRETLQENRLIPKIRKNLVRKLLDHMLEMADEDKDKYEKLWTNFGKYIKQGYRSDFENREKLSKLFRFNSSSLSEEKDLTSLQEYVERMDESQKEIYYVSGDSRLSIERSPHLEIFKKKGIEVLYLTDPVDDFLFEDLKEFQEKKIVSIDQEDIALDDVKGNLETKEEDKDEKDEKIDVSDKEMDELLVFFQTTLKDRVIDVRFSKKLIGSPCCLVTGKDAPGVGMQRLMKMMNEKYEMPKRILEINQKNPFIQAMAKIYATQPREEMLGSFCHQLLENAFLQEGSPLDMRDMIPRVQDMMNKMGELMMSSPEKKE